MTRRRWWLGVTLLLGAFVGAGAWALVARGGRSAGTGAEPAPPTSGRRPPPRTRPGPSYVGAGGCKPCHLREHRSWKDTPMARTFEVLRPRVVAAKKTLAGLDPSVDYTKDARCLSCHTTGHGEPSGYPEVAAGAEMTAEQREAAVRNEGVTCEACHGPGSLYGPYKKEHADHELADVVQLGLVSPPTAQDCTRCHVPECPTMPANYVFRFERAVGTTEAIHGHRPLRSHDAVGGR